jgi:FixJ family two-component response regulator
MNEATGQSGDIRDLLSVFIVEDDAALRDSLALLLGRRGYQTRAFDSANSFLAAAGDSGRWAGCLLTDVRMPGISGLELLARLANLGLPLPAVVMSAYGDVASVRQAFRLSAVDFLAKPFAEEDLVAAIEQSFAAEIERLRSAARQRRKQGMSESLTEREREIRDLIVDGLSNHEIADRLGISHRTAQVHRGHVMRKMGVATLAELIAACREHSIARS